MSSYREHEDAVLAFLEEKKEENPEEFEEVCDKYPVQNAARQRVVRNKEFTVGLLGTTPSRVSMSTAQKHDVETIYAMDEKG